MFHTARGILEMQVILAVSVHMEVPAVDWVRPVTQSDDTDVNFRTFVMITLLDFIFMTALDVYMKEQLPLP